MDMDYWEEKFKTKIKEIDLGSDPAHDLSHFMRVVSTAKSLATQVGAKLPIVIPAAWLHDLVNLQKNDPKRGMASKLSADAALVFLEQINYPENFFKEIHHAIHAHSFSAEIEAITVEAKIVQDADRLDALGAIGIARCFAVGGMLNRKFYNIDDPFASRRAADDKEFALDHFYTKLFKIGTTLQTSAGRKEGLRRVESMKKFLQELQNEIGSEKF